MDGSQMNVEKRLRREWDFLKMSSANGFEMTVLPVFEDYGDYVALWDKEKHGLIRFIDYSGVLQCYPMDATLQIVMKHRRRFSRYDLGSADAIGKYTYAHSVGQLDKQVNTSRQLGVEIIGDASSDADSLVIRTMMDYLKSLGYSQDELQLELGDVGWISGGIGETGEDEDELIRLLDNRSLEGLNRIGMGSVAEKHLKFGPWDKMAGDVIEVLGNDAYQRFAKVIGSLEDTCCSVTVDLAMTNRRHYYSDLIYRIYSKQEHKLLAQGGRYDGLAGEGIPACGMSLGLEVLDGN